MATPLEHNTLIAGTIEDIAVRDDILTFNRRLDDERFAAILNFGNTSQRIATIADDVRLST